jgi:hypothetical protein
MDQTTNAHDQLSNSHDGLRQGLTKLMQRPDVVIDLFKAYAEEFKQDFVDIKNKALPGYQ